MRDFEISEYKVESLDDALITAYNLAMADLKNDEIGFNGFELFVMDKYGNCQRYEEVYDKSFQCLYDEIKVKYKLLKQGDYDSDTYLNTNSEFDIDILNTSNISEKFYTGEFIEKWCKHHLANSKSNFNKIAMELYATYFHKDALAISPSKVVYYKVVKNNKDVYPKYKIIRNLNMSPLGKK